MANKNYYEILGVSRAASTDQIKQRYRQLARKYHPDVAEDKTAAKVIFLQIAEAYQTLINEDRRLLYDTSLDSHVFRAQQQPSRPSPPRPATETPKPPHEQRPSGSGDHTQSRAKYSETDRIKLAEIRRWLKEAEASLAIGQFRSSIYACKEVLRMDTRNVRAHIILGDVYRIQGASDQAIAMYTIAVQLDPKNVDVQAKLDRLFRKSKIEQITPEERGASLRMGVNFIGFAIGVYMLVLLALSTNQPIYWLQTHITLMDAWSRQLVVTLAAIGALSGFLLSVNEKVQRLDEELVFKSVHDSGISYPIALLLLVFSLFSFYMAVIVYVVIAIMQEALSRSVVVAFTATGALILISTLIYSSGHMQVLIFGGNVLFPTLMVGWMAGDIFRPSY
jgi:tetratricopeptide (TPR) repeat protein